MIVIGRKSETDNRQTDKQILLSLIIKDINDRFNTIQFVWVRFVAVGFVSCISLSNVCIICRRIFR